jgi:hypothetical protein
MNCYKCEYFNKSFYITNIKGIRVRNCFKQGGNNICKHFLKKEQEYDTKE